ncbi:MAG: hypothetical protein J6R09_00395 [Alistipes sp.]|nr:hypothetical protein [Alistipes sp.]
MVISLTRHSSIFATLFLLGVVVVSILRFLYAPFAIELADYGYMPVWREALLAALLFVVTGLVVGRTTVKIGAFSSFCTLPIALFAVVACGLYLSPNLLASAATALLTAVGILFMIRVQNEFGNREGLFWASLAFSTAAMIYPPLATFILILPIAILTLSLNLRQSIVAVVGFLLPFALYSYIVWYAGGNIDDVARHLWSEITTPRALVSLDALPYVASAISAILLLSLAVGMVLLRGVRYTMLAGPRKLMWFEVVMSLLSIASLALPGATVASLPVIAVSLAVVVAYALDNVGSRTGSLLYWLLLLAMVAHLFVE